MSNSDISKEKALEIFENMIVPQIIGNTSPQKTKEAFLLGGQPGSGKSSLARELLKMRQEMIFINGDDLRAYHPEYYFYLKKNDVEAADMTQEVCSFWIESLIQRCIERGLNLIVEGTMRKKEVPLKTARILSDANYSINLAFVAAPYELSLSSLEHRYKELKRMGIPARFTKKESHDEAFQNIESTLSSIIDSGLIKRFHVFKRSSDGFTESIFNQEQKEEILRDFIEGRMRPIEDKEKNLFSLTENEFKISVK